MEKRTRNLLNFLFVAYCGFLLWLLFARQPNPAQVPISVYLRSHINLHPFRTIRLFTRILVPPVRQSLVRAAIRNLAGNIFLFTPLGIFLPVLFPLLRSFFRTFFSTFLIISVIELTQLALMVGSCDVDDLMLNVLGASIGYGLYRLICLFRKKTL